jgi:uncharacterized peroxidase-related enzyme
MTFIKLKENLPGIVGLIYYKRSTGKALCHFTQAGLRGPSPLTVAERELIATYVSSLNECNFCVSIHGAVVNELAKDQGNTVACAINHIETPGISSKMRALLNIAGKVQQSGKSVTEGDIQAARDQGATDEEIHDTVYIAASFCFFNRYVDGLHTVPMKTGEDYVQPARSLLKFGYTYPNFIGRYFMKKMFRKALEAK